MVRNATKRRRLSVALSGQKPASGLGSDPRFSLLQALFERPKRGCDTRRRIGFRETRFMPKTDDAT